MPSELKAEQTPQEPLTGALTVSSENCWAGLHPKMGGSGRGERGEREREREERGGEEERERARARERAPLLRQKTPMYLMKSFLFQLNIVIHQTFLTWP